MREQKISNLKSGGFFVCVSIAPSSGPTSLRAMSVTSTSITIAWDNIPCMDRNTNITGYSVNYFAEVNDFLTMKVEFVMETLYMATGLLPRIKYNFTVSLMYEGTFDDQLYSTITVATAVPTGIYFYIYIHM